MCVTYDAHASAQSGATFSQSPRAAVEAVAVAIVGSTRPASVTVVRAPGGADHLAAHVVGHDDADTLRASATRAVAQALPEYMRPTVWTVLDTAPIGSSGKLDRRAGRVLACGPNRR